MHGHSSSDPVRIAPPPGISRHKVADAAQRDRYLESIHANLEIQSTAYAIVNDGRLLLGCDRLTLLESKGNYCRLLAASGTDQADRRGVAGQMIEELARRVVETQEPIYYEGRSSDCPPQVQQSIEDYVNQSHVRRFAAVPLVRRNPASATSPTTDGAPRSRQSVTGVLVVENFHAGGNAEQLWAETEDLCPQIALALNNALTHDRMPLASISRLLQRSAKQLQRPRTMLVFLLTVVFLLTILFGRIDHTVSADGRLLPKHRRNIFATADGVVTSVLVEHGDSVNQGEVLLKLDSSKLELEATRLAGELSTARQRLRTESTRQWNQESSNRDAAAEGQLAAQRQQLTFQIRAIESQLKLVAKQREQLTIRAPISGRIETWDTTQLLANRPVHRGQQLLSVAADRSDTWTAELSVRDRDAGRVLLAQQRHGPNLKVSFLVASDPTVSHLGEVQQVAIANHISHSGESALRVSVEVGRESLINTPSGAEVLARIHCGRRSIAFVWFHQLLDTFRRNVFL